MTQSPPRQLLIVHDGLWQAICGMLTAHGIRVVPAPTPGPDGALTATEQPDEHGFYNYITQPEPPQTHKG
jgi:hypothetical protein